MIKNNKVKLILSSLVILLPMVLGIIFWDMLPNEIPTHWGMGNEPDAFSGKGVGVFLLPLIMLAFQWICFLMTALDKKNQGQNKKMMNIVIWIIPVLSLFVYGLIISASFGKAVDASLFLLIIIALMFIILGNYLPKCKQNYTIGIKVKWTLENEENWNATHRICGKLWVIGGLIILFSCLLPENIIPWILVAVLIPLAVFPFVYSYVFYKRQLKRGDAVYIPVKTSKLAKIITAVIVSIILILVAVLMFTGDIRISTDENMLIIDADYYQDLKLDLSEFESIEFTEEDDAGLRTYGYGSARLLMGTFENEKFGTHTRYTYLSNNSAIILKDKYRVLVINTEDIESTKLLYEEIKNKTE